MRMVGTSGRGCRSASLTFRGGAAADSIAVTDGDGFRLNGERIRLWGIDAPEFGGRPFRILREIDPGSDSVRRNECLQAARPAPMGAGWSILASFCNAFLVLWQREWTAKNHRQRCSALNPKSRAGSAQPCQHHFYLAQTDAVYRENRRVIETSTKRLRLATRTSVIRIPVVVHVLYHEDEENLDVNQIETQIAAINRDYRFQNPDQSRIPEPFRPFATDTLIEFGLAVRDPQGNPTMGITRTRTSKSVFPYNPDDLEATRKLDEMIKFDGFGKAAWPRDSYLNLWTCNLGGGLLGYAQFPGGPAATDGVVIRNRAFGSTGIAVPPYNLGRTAVHEVGHWLNLLHIWGDDDGGCSASDNVDDTPNQGGSNGSEVRIENFPHISCENGPNGDMFVNYMDYVDDDTMMMFTKGQLKRMNATLAGPRASLANSMGLTPVHTARVEGEGLDLAAAEFALVRDQRGIRSSLEFDGIEWVDAASAPVVPRRRESPGTLGPARCRVRGRRTRGPSRRSHAQGAPGRQRASEGCREARRSTSPRPSRLAQRRLPDLGRDRFRARGTPGGPRALFRRRRRTDFTGRFIVGPMTRAKLRMPGRRFIRSRPSSDRTRTATRTRRAASGARNGYGHGEPHGQADRCKPPPPVLASLPRRGYADRGGLPAERLPIPALARPVRLRVQRRRHIQADRDRTNQHLERQAREMAHRSCGTRKDPHRTGRQDQGAGCPGSHARQDDDRAASIRRRISSRPSLVNRPSACGSAWKKDPADGVIGVQSGPRRRRVPECSRDHGSTLSHTACWMIGLGKSWALSGQIGLSLGGWVRSLGECATPSATSTAHPRSSASR